MDDLLILAVFAVLAIPVLLIIFMVWTVKLERRLRETENRVEELRLQHLQAATPAKTPAAPAAGMPEPSAEVPAKPAAAEAPSPWEAKYPPAPVKPAQPPAAPPPAEEAAPITPPKAVVLRADKIAALASWLKSNWIYAVSAVSLALAGLFFVQYGIEAGLLPPPARVAAALVFGAALVAAGEMIRRRWGDREEAVTAYLPSVFSGAGIVTLFGAILAALHLYDLITPTLAFSGLVAVAALAILLGWFSGPLLAAIGILGASVAPFLVGGDSDHPEFIYGYFAIVALAGLGIDAGRRWAWVSVLTLALVYPAGTLLYLDAGWPELFAGFLTLLVIATMAIPTLSLNPAHGGAAVIESFFAGRPRGWPEFPTRLVAGSMAASVAGLVFASLHYSSGFWIALAGLAVLFVAIAGWADRAEALEDLAVLPAAAIVALPVLQFRFDLDIYRAFAAVPAMPEGTPIPRDPYLLVGLAILVTLLAAWRSRRGARWPVAWAAGAALTAPAMVAGLEMTWDPARVIGAYPWAITATAVAGVMTGLALVFGRADGNDKARISGFVLAALAMIALALTVILTETALTLALAVTALAAALIDRRFDLRPLSVAVAVGAAVIGWRLIFDPGLNWAYDAPYWELLLAYGGSIAASVATLAALRPRGRPVAAAATESTAWSLVAIFASVLIFRLIRDVAPEVGTDNHWTLGLLAAIWLASAATQLWRSRIGGRMRWLRIALAGVFGLIGLFLLGLATIAFNPLIEGGMENRVLGPVGLNSLFPAYALPAAIFAFAAWRFAFLDLRLRAAFAIAAAALGALWLGLDIRHFWRGPDLSVPGTTQPELYSYTIAMLVTGAGLLWRAIARRSAWLRKIAMGVIALTIAKVFLVDASGLVGLLRVFSFLALGLALAGLAFLNRWAAVHTGQGARSGPE